MIILDGKILADKIAASLRDKVAALKQRKIEPCVGIILPKRDIPSAIFVKNKKKRADEIGIKIIVRELLKNNYLIEAKKQVADWNADTKIHGIVVQAPQTRKDETNEVIGTINPEKDIDCLRAENIGLLSLGQPRFLPPTPAGIMELLLHYKIKTEGKNAVIIGRSNLVGKPMALSLMQKKTNATVTVCHSKTPDLASFTKKADILIVAIGRPEFITGRHIKRGAAIIDVGIHKKGNKWTGDVYRSEIEKKAGAFSPVPGGVGPMTVIMLLNNAVKAAQN